MVIIQWIEMNHISIFWSPQFFRISSKLNWIHNFDYSYKTTAAKLTMHRRSNNRWETLDLESEVFIFITHYIFLVSRKKCGLEFWIVLYCNYFLCYKYWCLATNKKVCTYGHHRLEISAKQCFFSTTRSKYWFCAITFPGPSQLVIGDLICL